MKSYLHHIESIIKTYNKLGDNEKYNAELTESNTIEVEVLGDTLGFDFIQRLVRFCKKYNLVLGLMKDFKLQLTKIQ